jgi:alpha-1,2-glucosyltransferase
MSLLKPATWNLDFFLLCGGNDANTRRRRKERVALALVYLVVFVTARLWLGQVTKHVPEPYLVSTIVGKAFLLFGTLISVQDEVFHIPQVQAYCRGDFHVWDPKLTTPPGL